MENNINGYSPLALAFLGDAVFGLLVREKLVCEANRPADKLHKLSVKSVNANAQAAGAKLIMPHLTDDELSVLKRGRNAHTGHTPKNQSEGDYHYATGLESLFGWLYLKHDDDRIRELFEMINQNEVSYSESENGEPPRG